MSNPDLLSGAVTDAVSDAMAHLKAGDHARLADVVGAIRAHCPAAGPIPDEALAELIGMEAHMRGVALVRDGEGTNPPPGT